MDRNNIIPIARDAQETTASQRRHFRVLVAVLVIAWAAVLAAAVVLTPLPPLVPFAFLAVLVILAEHRFVLFGDETSMSGSMIVIVASVFVFADTSPLAGPVLIASLGGIYFPHLRARAWNLVAANSAIFGLSAGAAALAASWLQSTSSNTLNLAAAVSGVVSYWVTNSFLTGIASAIRNGDSVVMSTWRQIISEWQILFLSAAAAFLGMWLATNYRSTPLTFALLPVVAALPLHRPWRAGPSSYLFSRIFLIAGSWVVLVASFNGSLLSGALLALGIYLVSSDVIASTSRYPLVALIFVGTSSSLTFTILGLPRAINYPLAVGLAVAAAMAAYCYPSQGADPARRLRVPLIARIGLLAPAIPELCLLTLVVTLLALDQRRIDLLLAVAALPILSTSGPLRRGLQVARKQA
ncbi:MAG: hypothetical protein FJW77_08270 [Actinobacteria bacterium]|nr:hypothetical protein [Actinomycetota bacterium]